MRSLPRLALGFAGIVLTVFASTAWADPALTENDYYKLVTFHVPQEIVLEAAALEMMPDFRLAVSTRRGEIYLVDHPTAANPDKESKYHLFAQGLHEGFGLAYRDGWLYVTQRGELSRVKDSDGDGRADIYETVCDAWELDGDYHEFAWGSKFDKNGDIWVALCLTGSFTSENKYRGWCLRITPEGKAIPVCTGIRSPGGIAANVAGDMFFTENQGPWNGACSLKQLKPGAFLGHPAGLRWHEISGLPGPRPQEPKSGSRVAIEAKRIPQLLPAAVIFPYPVMGQSASGITCDLTGGKFGPFKEQLFVGDYSAGTVMRVFLEQVDGVYQGACFPFRKGFASGTLPVLLTDSGTLFVGGTNRGWGSRGNKPFALERLDWTGKVPFEVLSMRARHDGFELTFTEPVDAALASDPKSYRLTTYTYVYQSTYGSPEVDHTKPKVESVTVAADGKSVILRTPQLQQGHVHELHLDGVRSRDQKPLLHAEAYYTLNVIPRAADSK